jgi:hypothetical protein
MSLCIPSRHIRRLEANLHPLFTSSLEERHDPWRSRHYVRSEYQGTTHLAMQCCISEYENPNVLVVYKFLLLFIAIYQEDEVHTVDYSNWCAFPVRLYHRFYPSSQTSAHAHAVRYSTVRYMCILQIVRNTAIWYWYCAIQSGSSLVYVFRHFGWTIQVVICGWGQQALFEMWADFFQTSAGMHPKFFIVGGGWGGDC